MKCINPKFRDLVRLYYLDLVSGEQKKEVEDHLFQCDACFKEMCDLRPVFRALEEYPEEFKTILKPVKRPSILSIFSNLITQCILWLDTWQKRLFLGLSVATATAVLFIAISLINRIDYTDLAQFEHAPITVFKNAQDEPAITTLYNNAVYAYRNKNYSPAIENLEKYIQKRPDAPSAYFYLGVSYLLSSKPKENLDTAIDILEHGLIASNNASALIFSSRIHWYLANAYLSKNDVDQAKHHLYAIIDINKYKVDAANELLHQIQKREE